MNLAMNLMDIINASKIFIPYYINNMSQIINISCYGASKNKQNMKKINTHRPENKKANSKSNKVKKIELDFLIETDKSQKEIDQIPPILKLKVLSLNKIFMKNNIPLKFKIGEFLSYEVYKNIPRYEELMQLVGTDEIEKRFDSLKKIPQSNNQRNIVMLMSSNSDIPLFSVKKHENCSKHLLVNRSSDKLLGESIARKVEIGFYGMVSQIFDKNIKSINDINIDELSFDGLEELIPKRKKGDELFMKKYLCTGRSGKNAIYDPNNFGDKNIESESQEKAESESSSSSSGDQSNLQEDQLQIDIESKGLKIKNKNKANTKKMEEALEKEQLQQIYDLFLSQKEVNEKDKIDEQNTEPLNRNFESRARSFNKPGMFKSSGGRVVF